MKFHMEIQSEHFGQGRDLSIEGNVVKFFQLVRSRLKVISILFLKILKYKKRLQLISTWID
jgi:hypothetical protein